MAETPREMAPRQVKSGRRIVDGQRGASLALQKPDQGPQSEVVGLPADHRWDVLKLQ
jgi:hypothetical protein